MNLKEATLKLELVENNIKLLRDLSIKGSTSTIVKSLQEYSQLLLERQALSTKIQEAKLLNFEDEEYSILEIEETYKSVRDRISLISDILNKKDCELSEDDKNKLLDQLLKLQDTEISLALQLEKCFWETELLN